MPNITMCTGDKCTLKENCYRFLAKPNELEQSYFVYPPYDFKNNDCEHYWDNILYNKIINDCYGNKK